MFLTQDCGCGPDRDLLGCCVFPRQTSISYNHRENGRFWSVKIFTKSTPRAPVYGELYETGAISRNFEVLQEPAWDQADYQPQTRASRLPIDFVLWFEKIEFCPSNRTDNGLVAMILSAHTPNSASAEVANQDRISELTSGCDGRRQTSLWEPALTPRGDNLISYLIFAKGLNRREEDVDAEEQIDNLSTADRLPPQTHEPVPFL